MSIFWIITKIFNYFEPNSSDTAMASTQNHENF